MTDIKKVEIVTDEEPKQVPSKSVASRVKTQAPKAEATVTIPVTQMEDIMARLAKVEKESGSKAVMKAVRKFNPVYKLPIWNKKLIENIELIKTQSRADNGKLIFEQSFKITLYKVGEEEQEIFTTDLGTFGAIRRQVPAELVEYIYKKGEFDSKGNPIIDKYKLKIINWTIQNDEKIEWWGVPKELIGREFIVGVNLLNS